MRNIVKSVNVSFMQESVLYIVLLLLVLLFIFCLIKVKIKRNEKNNEELGRLKRIFNQFYKYNVNFF